MLKCVIQSGVAKVYKLVCVYYILGNIETRYWSKLRNIHVAVVAKSLLAKKHGYMANFHKLKDDLITLEKDGILVKLCDGTSKIFHGGIATISGDNLSSHESGRFHRCFSSGLICRTCLCSYEDIRRKMHEPCFNLRSPEIHKYHVDSVMKDDNLIPVYGVHCESPFNS